MNAALGMGGVTLGVAGSLLGVVTMVVGLRRRRADVLQLALPYACLLLGAAAVCTLAMEIALVTHDFSL